VLRFLVLWCALYVAASSIGMGHAVAVAILYGLSLKFDYWSNSIELLAGCLVLSGFVPGPIGMALGLVLGLGRETLPFLALAGGWWIALGAAAATLALRRFTKRDPQWDSAEEQLQYGKPQWRRNLAVLGGFDPPAYLDVAVYCLIAGLAFPAAPLLTVALVGTTFVIARIDEPRVLTMLIPWAALTVTKWLSLG
jgi:hypothetical protein